MSLAHKHGVMIVILAAAIFVMSSCSTTKVRQVQQPETHQYDRKIASNEPEDVVASMKAWVKKPVPGAPDGFYTKLEQIDAANLQKAETTVRPWSGSYWPDRIGGVAAHYRLTEQKINMIWKPTRMHKKFMRKHNRFAWKLENLTEDEIATMSAAEKYDLWMGDADFTFSHKIWEGILQQHNSQAGMPMWSGLCNGWTASSIVLNRPRRSVKVKAPDGKTITFYPDDLKALAALLYGHNFVDAVNYGTRCNLKKPPRRKGVVLDLVADSYARSPDECRDLNPGAWHLSIVNRIAGHNLGFVMDKDYNETVNNHVVFGYRYNYFNPRSGREGSYEDVRLGLDEYGKDPFGNVRHPKTKWVVGVKMDVAYLQYIMPIKGHAYDDESLDNVKNFPIQYDLEIAEDGTVVGGNWRINKKQKAGLGLKKPRFPDFMWYFDQSIYSTAEYVGENLGSFDILNWPLPEDVRKKAKIAAETRWKIFSASEQAEVPIAPYEYKEKAKKLDDELKRMRTAGENTAEIEAEIATFKKQMDEEGIRESYPFVQPLASVVYALFEAAKEADPDAPRDAPMDVEKEEESESENR